MARSKEYNRQDVLDLATHLFWTNGYTATTMSMLIAATGLGKRSMYQEFGGKESLYKECLQNYILNLNKEANALLPRKPLGLQNIIAFFENRIDYASSCDCNGCMVVNAALEKESIDEKAFSVVENALDRHEDIFLECLLAAQENGEIPSDKDCKALAGYLMTFSMGMMVKSRTGADRKSLEAGVKTLLSAVIN